MRSQRRFYQAVLVILAALGFVLLILHIPSRFLVETTVDYDLDFHDDSPSEDCQDIGTSALKGIDSTLCLGNRNIFLLETSTAKCLSARQACAVESAIRHNPSYVVNVLMTSHEPLDLDNALMRHLANTSNVQIARVDIGTLVYGTPLWQWYNSKKWNKSDFKVFHQSDALRLFLLWRYGGIYLDMDVVVLRSMEHMRNVTISDNGENVGNSVLVFDRGHELLRRCIIEFNSRYDSTKFADNGPILLNRKLKDFCGVNNIFEASAAKCNVQVLTQDAVFPIHWERWEDYFKPTSLDSVRGHYNTSYALHVWNKLSISRKMKFGGGSLYEMAMKENCPTVHEYTRTLEYF